MIIGIDEGQFFSDIVLVIEKLCKLDKIIIVATLNSNFNETFFKNF